MIVPVRGFRYNLYQIAFAQTSQDRVEIAIIRLLIFALILFLFIVGIVLAIYFLISRSVQKPTLSQDQRKREERKQQWLIEAKARGYREPRNDAEQYRDFVRFVAGSPPEHRTPYKHDEFYKWLEEKYEEASKDSKFTVSTARFAIGLMTYGRLDMIDVAVENIADSIRVGLVGYIPFVVFLKLLPLPAKLSDHEVIRDDLEPLRAWLKEHKSQLRWDDEQGKFVLMD